MSELRVGIIGGGWIARVHVPAIDAAPGLELVAACDLDARAGRGDQRPARRDGVHGLGGDARARAARRAVGLHPAAPPPRRRSQAALAAACTSTSRSRSPARSRTPTRSSPRRPRRARSARSATSTTRASCSTTRARCSTGSRSGMLVSRNFGPVGGPAVVHGSRAGRRPDPRAREPPHRSAAGARRDDRVGAGDGRRASTSRRPAADAIEDAIALVLQFASGALGSVHSAWTRDGQPELYAVDIVADDATFALQLGPEAFRLTGRARRRRLAREHGEPMDRSIARFVEAVRSGDPAPRRVPAGRRPATRSPWHSRASGRSRRRDGSRWP